MVLEAIAAKVPLISTNVGGIPEIFGPDARVLLPPGDVNALAAEMLRMQSDGDPELIDRLRARIAKFFTVESHDRRDPRRIRRGAGDESARTMKAPAST